MVLYAWALSKGYKPKAAIDMLQGRRGSGATILDTGKSGPRHFKPQIEYIYYGLKGNPAEALEVLKDGCVVLPEWKVVA